MTQIFQAGALNTTALIVPDLYVGIVPPQTVLLNGVPTNVLGIVGSAPWGPVNSVVIASSMGDFAVNFGAVMARKYDLGTAMAISVLQGANNFRLVRVTDGTDTKATVSLSTNITFTAAYTGSLGNQLAVTISAGSMANTWRVVVSLPGFTPETFDNLASGLTGNAIWVAIASAINNGVSALRPASKLITAAALAGTAAPVAGTTLFSTGTLGTDGVTGLTDQSLVGVDGLGSVRTGMYVLRGQGCSIAFLQDVTTVSTFTTQVAFGLSEQIYMIGVTAAGDSVTTAPAIKAGAGIDSYAFKYMFGDWLYWYDQVNLITRLVSPQGFIAGRLANMSPEQSSLNKQMYGIIGSQKNGLVGTAQDTNYSVAELQALATAGIDVIANPQPGGSYWGARIGHNSSSNAAINGDNYTRLTNYLAVSLGAGMGQYVGQLVNQGLFQQVRATLNSFLASMLQQGLLGTLVVGQRPYNVICDLTNNPASRTGLGYVQADVAVTYQAINEKFIINIQGGQTVVALASAAPVS
jgi:phage tail sheath protein FI